MPGEFYIEGKKEKVDLSQLVSGISELETKVDSLTAVVFGLEGKAGSPAHMDFWSVPDDVINLPASPADIDLPDVEVAGIPAGLTVVRVVAILKTRIIENTSGSGSNAINGSQVIRVKKSSGDWGVDDIDAVSLPDNLWTIAASTREMGDLLIGSSDVKSQVDSSGTYNFRFEQARVDLNYLRLNDVMVGLRFYMKIG
jgi:hypothetical protein